MKNVILPQPCTAVSGGANGLYHLPERRKRLKVSEDEEELCRDENASLGLGTFPHHESAYNFCARCPTALPHSLLYTCAPRLRDSGRYSPTLHSPSSHAMVALNMVFCEFFMSLDLRQRESLCGKLAGENRLPEGSGFSRAYCGDMSYFQTRPTQTAAWLHESSNWARRELDRLRCHASKSELNTT